MPTLADYLATAEGEAAYAAAFASARADVAADPARVALATADQASNLNNTMVASTLLTLPVLANKTYSFDLALFLHIRDIAADAKWGFVPITGATVHAYASNFAPSNLPSDPQAAAQTITTGTATIFLARFAGLLITGANAGNFTVQFAQNTTTATAGAETLLKRGSWLKLYET